MLLIGDIAGVTGGIAEMIEGGLLLIGGGAVTILGGEIVGTPAMVLGGFNLLKGFIDTGMSGWNLAWNVASDPCEEMGGRVPGGLFPLIGRALGGREGETYGYFADIIAGAFTISKIPVFSSAVEYGVDIIDRVRER